MIAIVEKQCNQNYTSSYFEVCLRNYKFFESFFIHGIVASFILYTYMFVKCALPGKHVVIYISTNLAFVISYILSQCWD